MESYLSKSQFKFLADNLINHIVAKEFHIRIDIENLILRIYRDHNTLKYDEILDKYSTNETPTAISLIKLVVLSDYSLKAFASRNRINTQFAWRLILDVLTFFNKNNPVSTIGSQGFVSIELYRFESGKDRKILRLHIWDESFSINPQNVNLKKYEIHSHLFNAQSHVLAGSILNERFDISSSNDKSENSLYQINWKSITNDDGISKRQSDLTVYVNHVKVTKLSSETIGAGQDYSVSINEYHSSRSLTPISATLFLFNSYEGLSELSKVVGPKNDPETGFRYEKVNFLPSLYNIDREIKKYYSKQKLLALDWMRKIHTLEHAHRIESRHLNTFSEFLSWSMVIIPATISGLMFYLNKSNANNENLILWVAILAGISVLLGTINKVIKPSDLSEKHRINSQNFEHLRHKLEKYIVFNNDERLDTILSEIQSEWTELTLHNVKEYNFKRASEMIKAMKVYPEKLSFLKT